MPYADHEQYLEYQRTYQKSHKKDSVRQSKSNRRYYLLHREEELARVKLRHFLHREEDLVYLKLRREEAKKQTFNHYGWKCICCGEIEVAFLTIDHINNDGAEHRRKVGPHLYEWLVRNNFPESFQTLCRNCNWAKHTLGVCPHKKKEQ